MYLFDGERSLTGKAFYDIEIFIVSISTIKNYLLVGDMYKSIWLLAWKV
jgi:cleavage and polyadenylation specificity factor subunit 1